MILMIDNYDSFVYNLVRYFEELDEKILIVRNDEIKIEDIEKLNIHGIVISPGPKSPAEAGISLDVINVFKGKVPILGICLGHQAIGYAFGGNVIRGRTPVHGKVHEVTHNGKGIFKGLKNPMKVTRYHSLIIENNLPSSLEISCKLENEEVIMGIEHKKYPIYGVQFHPEAHLTEEGHKLLKNFINICNEHKRKRL